MRRTPTLTAECRRLFEEMYNKVPGKFYGTSQLIAEATGLSKDQVITAIWGIGADEWRQGMYARFSLRNGPFTVEGKD